MRRHIFQCLGGILSIFLLAAVPLIAQNAAPASASPPAPPPASAAAQESPKKVWTNDDVTELRDSTTISTFNTAKAKAQANALRPANSRGRDATWYRNQIATLQAQVPPLNDQIAELQAALDGKPTGDEKASTRPYSVKIDSWTVQRDELTKKRDGILAQIDGLRDEARHNGIPDSALR